jgi:anti-anti-sigma factor
MVVYAPDQMRLSVVTSADRSVVFVRIVGDVDLSNVAQLDRAAEQLGGSIARTIYADLGGTTFMGSTLVTFLVRIANVGIAARSLILCRPTPSARRVIQMTGLEEFARIRADLPPDWPDSADDLTADQQLLVERPGHHDSLHTSCR